MKPQEDRLLHQENADDIVSPLTINQVNTNTASPDDEAELAQIWQHESKFNQISFKEREILDGAQESESVILATTLL
jgi:hypothetical protein